MKAELFLKANAELAEGIIYDEKEELLYWVDIEGKAIHKTSMDSRMDTKTDTPARVGALFLTGESEVYAALEDGVYRQRENNMFVPYAMLPKLENIRTNDGKCDAAGCIWLGTMAMDGRRGAGAFYKFERGNAVRMLSGIGISNGLAFSPDNRCLYYVDTLSGYLWRFDFDLEHGTIENRTALIDYRERQGAFDGMTIDADGQLWVAEWNGSRVSGWDARTGKQTAEIMLPVPRVSCCTFGGKNYSDLYITTAKSEGDPLSGSLFICRDTGAKGMPVHRFSGEII